MSQITRITRIAKLENNTVGATHHAAVRSSGDIWCQRWANFLKIAWFLDEKWCARRELNPQPSASETDALSS
jgi:hypothetical protein